MEKPSIIFMGTAEFAVPSLKILIDSGFDIKAVVTATDKPAGRGKHIQFSDVKKFALEQNLNIMQPEKLKDSNFLNELKILNADLFVVVAFRMLSKDIWTLPKLGTINLHAALLPNYRGAAPINHAIINGETKTGVTTFFIDEQIDTGNIILQHECEILPEDNIGTLYDKLQIFGANLVLETVNLIADGNIKPRPQPTIPDNLLKHAPKITKEFCQINWNDNVVNIHNLIRGLSPYPCAFSNIDENNIIKFFKTSYTIENHDFNCGDIITDNKKYLKIAAKDGFLNVEELQISGKKCMDIRSFLAGNKIGDSFSF